MRTHFVCAIVGGLLPSLTFMACGPSNLENPPCLVMSQPNGAALFTAKPAKVSMLFQVDTCQGEPVSGLASSAFTVSENGTVVSALESQRSIRPKGQRYRLSTVLMLDLSGSLLRSGQLPALQQAALAFATSVLGTSEGTQRLAVYAFDGQAMPEQLVPFTNDLALVRERVANLSVSQCQVNADCALVVGRRACASNRCVDDSTNLNGALVEGLRVIETQTSLETTSALNESALVLFTDGSDQAARVSPEAALSASRSSRTRIFTVGFGADVDAATLRSFGKDGFFSASTASELSQAFEGVASRIARLANRYYLLEYCSPKRSGRHSLKITANVERGGVPMVGGLSSEFDAKGFESGCSVE